MVATVKMRIGGQWHEGTKTYERAALFPKLGQLAP